MKSLKTYTLASAATLLLLAGACQKDKELTVVEIPVTPYEIPGLWMVGNATPADWNIDAPTVMVKVEENVFSYTGHLNEGEFKCPMEPGNWGGPFVMPPVNGTVIDANGVETNEILLMPDGNPDNKWVVTEAGDYSILINGNDHTITATKLN